MGPYLAADRKAKRISQQVRCGPGQGGGRAAANCCSHHKFASRHDIHKHVPFLSSGRARFPVRTVSSASRFESQAGETQNPPTPETRTELIARAGRPASRKWALRIVDPGLGMRQVVVVPPLSSALAFLQPHRLLSIFYMAVAEDYVIAKVMSGRGQAGQEINGRGVLIVGIIVASG